LQRAGFGLRVRVDRGRYVQTLKSRTAREGGIKRTEWETEVDGERPDPVALAETPAVAVVGRSVLSPVFVTDVERTTRLWIDGANVVEVSLDRGEIIATDRRQQLRELELELKAGTPEALFGLAETLVGSFPARLSLSSKSERGYQLAAGEQPLPLRAVQGATRATSSTADCFHAIAWSCLNQVMTNAELLVAKRDSEALHQMRVGLRRLRAALATFSEMLVGHDFSEIRSETKWLASQLDRARDLDVFIRDTFRPAFEEDKNRSAYAEFGAELLKAQAAAYERAIAAIESQRYAQFLVKAATWLEVGDWSVTTDPVVSNLRRQPPVDTAARQLRVLRRKIVKGGRKLSQLDPKARHKLRIKAKKLRYAVEFFADTFNERRREFRHFKSAVGRLQEELGDLQYSVVAQELAGDLVQGKSPQLGLAAGLMVGARQKKIDHKAAIKAMKQFRKTATFWRAKVE
jgi:inorganic triphosphatase YgiF